MIENLDSSKAWRAVIPDFAIYKIGVVYDVPLDLTIEDILEGIDAEDRAFILRIERCRKKVDNVTNPIQWEDTDSIKIYCRKSIPKEISIYSFIYKISAYILPVRQCTNCLRFGHIKNNCNNNYRCLNCGGEHEEINSASCKNETKCANCQGPHTADNKEYCIFYQYNTELNQIRATLQCSVAEAETILKRRYKKIHKPEFSSAEFLTVTKQVLSDGNLPVVHQFDARNPYRISKAIPTNATLINNTESPIQRSSNHSTKVQAPVSTPATNSAADNVHPVPQHTYEILHTTTPNRDIYGHNSKITDDVFNKTLINDFNIELLNNN